ncbi:MULTISPECIES: M20/M25/M40 family metallo-hydrolase [Cryobacterium]|uniref:M20/M25/M40 family metallo-hydrolase n=1 Tax=Cryobacterium glucosi TaxID=1259175 RepID=A0ABY2ITR6_9MICO|nr:MULTISPECIES: M20/M25/M40 family metallo-hydrolase [Cryobacterium]MDY7527772.1 M20/M25/M40 family metallo-hydrolase [Cryobacterium sp. 10C2]MDY7556457.1 M20/M25/M40 family metallo-hydrolase [Cryobacterium sp. 10C3]MEB0001726.1 M20/M25/M40 family metallo-hydrolase [Cryobacterium sp. RTC2.1]MEB0200199.1 M20/M25/M40 family metallo-hydrolase [Cryobacterium sp. 5I3]MEB0285101.1 M20/M25/M40 family metallo-hydrolase [Cryobacterium sp. 10S3]
MASWADDTDPATPLDLTAELARDLIRFDTTNYGEGRSNGETDAAEYVAEHLRGLGLAPELFDSEPGRTSVVVRVPGRNRDAGALVVHGHLDVVPADPETWSVDPFAGVIKDGLLWGRGAVDMKNMDAMILAALGDILGAGEAPARDLIVAFFADEEAGGVLGSHYLVDTRPELFAGATEAISEVGGYSITLGGQRAYLLQTGEKALIWIKLVARGDAAHGSRLIRNNAVTKLATAVAAIGRREWPIRLTDTTTQLLAEIARILDVDPQRVGPDELALATGTASGFIQASLRTTTNPTLLKAGYKHNVIPDLAEALIDIRTLPGEEDAVLAEVASLVGPDIEIVVMHRDIGLETDFGGPLVDAVVGSLHRHDPGAPVLPYLLSAGTDNKALSKLGIRGYGFAPLRLPAELDFPGMFHGVDERVPLDALVFGRRVLTDLLSTY